MPPTLVAEDKEVIRFANKYEAIIIKPLYGCGGEGIVKMEAPYDDLEQLITSVSEEPLMIQQYRDEIKIGDKRVIISSGEVVGEVLRVPAKGQVAANFHAGGTAVRSELSKVQRDICERLGKVLNDRGLYFVGLDFIGDFLTEINVTSPTGIQEINNLYGEDITMKYGMVF